MSAQPRRKKTNAEIKRDRAAREKKAEIERTSIAWDDLRNVHNACNETMQETATSIAKVLRVPGLEQRLGDKLPEVKRMAGEMARDVDTYKQTLKDISAKYEGQSGLATGLAKTMGAIAIGEEYNQWTESFQNVVVQRANEILRIVEDTVDPIIVETPSEETPNDE